MQKSLKVLIVEDSESDGKLLVRFLKNAGYDLTFVIVETAAEMRAALEKQTWEIIISDYAMPQFSGSAALVLLQEMGLNIPFIIVSGTMGEETAVAMMRAGASDYIMKGNLSRLLPALERELSNAIVRQERINAEALLRLESAALNAAANAIVITDRDGIIQWVNSSFVSLTGYQVNEAIGRNPREIVKSGQHDSQFYKLMWDTIITGKVWRGELINKRKDGTLYNEEQTITPVKNEKGVITNFIAIKQDITEQRKLQQQLFQSQKVESIGTLAGGIAHDFNNILGIILAYTTLLERGGIAEAKLKESYAAINKAVLRGASLVKQILTFARKTDVKFTMIKIPHLIHELIAMLQETFPKMITIIDVIDDNIPSINADQTQIHQALLNLCVNARDAMPNGGILTITATIRSKDELPHNFNTVEYDTYLCIGVTDTGTGIDPETVKKIFDPFFTTKEIGKGTGMGLSVVNGVAQAHHGYINVESRVGSGTTFSLYIPVPQGQIQSQNEASKKDNFIQGGDETILLVEDEDLLRDIVAAILTAKGYTVIIAKDGEEAISVYRERHKEIALVFTDMGLPKRSGVDEFWEMKNINPNVKVIMASGFLEPNVKSDLFLGGAKGFIQKPYSGEEVLKIVREVLDVK